MPASMKKIAAGSRTALGGTFHQGGQFRIRVQSLGADGNVIGAARSGPLFVNSHPGRRDQPQKQRSGRRRWPPAIRRRSSMAQEPQSRNADSVVRVPPMIMARPAHLPPPQIVAKDPREPGRYVNSA